jgi:hypothetical protein
MNVPLAMAHVFGVMLVTVVLGCSDGREPRAENDAGVSGGAGGSDGAGTGGVGTGGAGSGGAAGKSGAAGQAGSGTGGAATAGAAGGRSDAGGAAGQAGMSCRGFGASPGSSGEVQPGPSGPAVGCNGDGGNQLFPKPDECGCRDLVCGAGETCLRVFQPPPSALGGPGSFFNGCFELCSADADCGPNRSCAMTFYGVRECGPWICRTTSECTADPCAECRLGVAHFHASWIRNEAANRCVYEGLCRPSSCPSCEPYGDDAHICP